MKQKILLEGLDPSVLDSVGDGSAPPPARSAPPPPAPPQATPPPAPASKSEPVLALPAPGDDEATKVKNDPMFKPYFKMLMLGIPRPQVEHKMNLEGIDPAILDNPDGPSPNQNSIVLVE